MTLFFDLYVLESQTKTDQALVNTLYNSYYNKYLPKNKGDVLTHNYIPNLQSGNSFLLNPDGLFQDYSDYTYKAQYIKLAGRRDYLKYKLNNIKYLDLGMYPDINIENIKSNTLINIHSNKITFKYEELQ